MVGEDPNTAKPQWNGPLICIQYQFSPAHDNVKVFITHGGLLSMQEAIYHATPLLSIPILGEQPKIGAFTKNSGLGDMLRWEELTPEVLINALTEVTTNPK